MSERECSGIFLSRSKEQVCVFVATKTSRMPSAPGKLAFCARWLQKGKEIFLSGFRC